MHAKTPRNSSLELLRIIAMLIIIMQHFGVHGIFHVLEPSFNILATETFSWQLMFTQLICWGGPMGNAIFILITGYFMINRSVHWQKLLLLLITMLLYSWIIEGIVYGGKFLPYTFSSLIHETFPMLFGLNWFVSCYLIFSLFIPYINRFLLNLNKEEYERLLLMLFLAIVVFPAIKFTTFFDKAPILFFGLVYACGGYLRLHGKNWTVNGMHHRHLVHFIILLIIIMISIIAFDAIGVIFHKEGLLRGGSNPIIQIAELPMAISLFLYFLTRPRFYNMWINKIAGTVLGIYLIHDNDLVRKLIWDYILPNLNYIQSYWYALFYIAKVIVVFGICCFIDLLRKKWIEPRVVKWMNKF